jgi:alpha,alpha-trehalase
MAVWLFCRALEIMEILPEDRLKMLREDLGLKREEVARWDDISRKMRVVFHSDGIISQLEGYGDLEEFDWAGYRKKYGDIHRPDRILEAEGDTPNRYKLSKQADVLMLFYLLSADELGELFARLGYPFEYETIPKNIEYYMKRISHGSTLSRMVHSWVLARSRREASWHLFKDALESDISDIQGGTTHEGIHLGAMAGTVDIIQRCYTGIETRGDTLRFNPYVTRGIESIRFMIRYRGHRLDIKVTENLLRVRSAQGDAAPIRIAFRNDLFELAAGNTMEFVLGEREEKREQVLA